MAMITQYSNLLNNTIEVPDDVDPLALQQAEQDMFMQQQQQQQAMQQGGQGIGGGQGGGALGFLGNLVNTATDYASAPGMFYAPSVAGAYAMTPEGFNQHMTRMQGTLNQQNAQRAQAQESAADRQQRSQIAQAQNRLKMQQMLQDQEDQKNELKFREQSLDIKRRQVDLQENTQAFYQKMKEREEAKPMIKDGMQLDYNEKTGQYSARPVPGLPVDMEYFDKNTGQYIVNGPNGPEWRMVPGSPDIGGGYVGTGGSGVVGTAGGGGPRGRSSGGRSGGGSSGGASVDAKGTVTINGKKYKPQDRYHTWFVDEEGNTLTRDQMTGLIEAEESTEQTSETSSSKEGFFGGIKRVIEGGGQEIVNGLIQMPSDIKRGAKNWVNWIAPGAGTNREQAVSQLIEGGGQEIVNGLIQMPSGKVYNVYGDGKIQELSEEEVKFFTEGQ